jgi:hypothetical protein
MRQGKVQFPVWFAGKWHRQPGMFNHRCSNHLKLRIRAKRELVRELTQPRGVMLAQVYREDGKLGWSLILERRVNAPRWTPCKMHFNVVAVIPTST